MRWIMHVDMDAFFASVEQLDAPELRGRPVVVGQGVRGVAAAASYEARAFGVRSAMPLSMARRLCPHAVFVPGRRQRYEELSRVIMQTLGDFSPLVEPASIDEAYLDATGLERLFGPVEELARRVKEAVRAAAGLACSVGVAPVKFLAKIASDINKPDGVYVLRHADVPEFLRELPVRRLPGVGREFLKELEMLGVRTAGQVSRYPADFWERRFGKVGTMIHARAQGLDPRGVEPVAAPKSESAERTFERDTLDMAILRRSLLAHAERVGEGLRRQGLAGRTVTLKIKYADFTQVTRSRTLPHGVNATQTIFEVACALLESLALKERVRLVGVGVSGFQAAAEQGVLPLGEPAEDARREERRLKLDNALDEARRRFGKRAVVRGRLF